MKTRIFAFAFSALLLLGSASVFAFDPPRQGGPAGSQQGICDGTGPKQGQMKGKRQGPRDGSGPMHEPGTGGGSGAGQRRGRR